MFIKVFRIISLALSLKQKYLIKTFKLRQEDSKKYNLKVLKNKVMEDNEHSGQNEIIQNHHENGQELKLDSKQQNGIVQKNNENITKKNESPVKKHQIHLIQQDFQTDQSVIDNSNKKNPIITQQNNYNDMLATRPTNQFAQKPVLPPLQDSTIQQANKTSTDFYTGAKKKTINMVKSKSSQKFIPYKNTFQVNKSKQQTPIPFNNFSDNNISDITVLILLYRVVQRMRQRGDDMTMECLMNEQKLIFISMAFLEKKMVKREDLQGYFSLEKEIISFVQKINKVTMENFKEQDENINIKIFSKAVELLMTPNLNRFVKDIKTLGKVKVLTFNNLACIYKRKRKFGIALRSVSFALQIEQALLFQQSNEQKYDIIPTYLNKAAILSEMNKHEKAIEQIMKSQKFIEKIQRQVIKQIAQAESNSNTELKKRLQEKRYYGLYMRMIINYNMGAEKEHMKMSDIACQYYKQGRQLAIMINNDFMVKKFQTILNKISQTKRK